MKTLAEFKRDIKVGTEIEYVQCQERAYDHEQGKHVGEWYETEIPLKIRGVRVVSYVDTTGFYLKHRNDGTVKRGSFCGYPKADNLAYVGDTFTIVEVAKDGEPYQMRSYKIIKPA